MIKGEIKMENNIYAKAYKEVLVILERVPEEDVKKIPDKMINMFKIKQDINYDYKLDETIPFEEQKMLIETKAILANIYRDYWATPEEREQIIAKENLDRAKEEEEKREKYNPDDLFKNRKKENSFESVDVEEAQNTLPVEIKKENFFSKLISFIRNLFRR